MIFLRNSGLETLISADQTFAVWAALAIAATIGLFAETTRIGRKLSGAVITMGAAFVLSNARIIPASGASPYDAVWTYVVPLAIPLLLLRADLRRILREAGPTLIAFIIGAIGTIIGTLAAYRLVPLGPEGWKIAGVFAATYIGGSINYAATAEALQLRSGDLLSAGVAADNLVMVLYFLLLFTLPSLPWLRRRYVIRHRAQASDVAEMTPEQNSFGQFPELKKSSLSVAFAFAICALGYQCAEWTGVNGGGILFVTGFTVIIATAFPRWTARLDGAETIGCFFMQIFFAVIGASANIGMVLRVGPSLFVFAALILSIHLAVLLILGFLFRLDLVELVIASNANMGGPTTAAAMAVARRWQSLVLPAILCGTFGYTIATFIGVGLGNWLFGAI